MKKAQTTLIAIVLLILIFSGIVLMLSSTTSNSSQTNYPNVYVNNMLLSFLKIDTGITEHPQFCRSVTEILLCADQSPSFVCGINSCKDIAKTYAEIYFPKLLKPKTDYYFEYGNKGIGNSDILLSATKWMSAEKLVKSGVPLNVRLHVGRI